MSSDLIATVTGWYQEPMFWLYPMATLAISFSTFLLFAVPYTVLAWIDLPALAKYKVQDKPFDVAKWLGPTLGRLLFNNAAMAVILVLSWPWMRLTPIHLGELPAWYVILAQLLFFIFLDDFLYYWVHRAMHKGWLLKHVHSIHHRIRQTSAINGNYFHLLEFIIINSLALIGPWLVGAHLYVLWIWIVIRQFEAADGHCGYGFRGTPATFFHSIRARVITTSTTRNTRAITRVSCPIWTDSGAPMPGVMKPGATPASLARRRLRPRPPTGHEKRAVKARFS